MHGPVTDEVRAAEERQLHEQRWQWGGRLPSERLRGVRGSNVLGLLAFDSDLVHALDAVGPEVQRAVALLAARRAVETAGLTDVLWVAQALTELAQGHPLPPPFDDEARMSETLRSTPLVPGPPVLMAMPPERPPYFPLPPAGWTWVPTAESRDDGARRYELGRLPDSLVQTISADRRPASPADMIHSAALLVWPASNPHVPEPISQPHFALPAVLAAADPAPLRAALDAVWHALNTYGEHYPELLEEIRSICTERAGE